MAYISGRNHYNILGYRIIGCFIKGGDNLDSFSKVLKDHICRMDIKIQNLAFASGVDRSLIQKMIKGDRVPANKDVLEKIILALMLTPRQAAELRSLYHIARIGEDVYQRHLLVKDVLESFGLIPYQKESIIKSNYFHTLENDPYNSIFYGAHEVNLLVKTVIEMEANKENALLKIIVQPDFPFVIEHMAIMGSTYNNLIIEHIFCLQESIKEKDDNRYNLICIKNIAPLITSGCSYNPYIYYDDVPSHINSTSIFPYMIITSTHVVTISYDFTQAVLYQDSSFHKLYSSIYNRIKLCTIELIEKLPTPMDTFNYFERLENPSGKPTKKSELYFTMFTQPCLIFFLSKAMIFKYTLDIPYKEELVELLSKRSEKYLEKIKAGYDYTTYFSLEGIKDFWESGRIREIPDEFYTPLDQKDRYYLLNMLYDVSLNYNYNSLLVNNSSLQLTNNLVVSATDDCSISLIYHQPGKEAISFTLKEKSLTYSFFRFFEYLKSSDSDFVLPQNKTLEILKEQLDLYKKELITAKNNTNSYR